MKRFNLNLLCFMAFLLSAGLLLNSCKKEGCRPGCPPACNTRVIFKGPHFCSRIKLQKTDGSWSPAAIA